MFDDMEAKRKEVTNLIWADLATSDIMSIAAASKSMVCILRKHVAAGEDLRDKAKSGWPCKLTLDEAKEAFSTTPTIKMTEFAKEKDAWPATVSNTIKATGGKSVKRTERLMLSHCQQEVCLERCKQILNDLKHKPDQVIFFSDEKTFAVDPVYNTQNDRVVCFGNDDNEELHYVSKTKHPASVMMLGVVVSTGAKMPPVWFLTRYCLMATEYLQIRKMKVPP